MKQFYFAPFLNEVFFDLLNFKHNKSISLDVLMRQILFTGYQALGLVSLIALLLGAVIIVEGHNLRGHRTNRLDLPSLDLRVGQRYRALYSQLYHHRTIGYRNCDGTR